MPQMRRVLHIIDKDTPGEVLDQLALLVGPDERIISLGIPSHCGELRSRIETIHRPMGSGWLAGWFFRRRGPGVQIIHAWSMAAVRAASAIASGSSVQTILSLPFAPGPGPMAKVVKLAGYRGVHLIVPTQASRDTIGGRIETVSILPPTAAAPNNRSARRRQTRQALGIADDDVLLIAPAEMTPDAGHFQAIWTHAIIRQMLPNVRLLLPGGGPFQRSVRFFAGTTRLEAEIFLTGEDIPLPDALAGADVALFLAQNDVPLGSLAAAMAAGLPIVASDRGDIAEFAPHDRAALLVKVDCARAHGVAALKMIESPDVAKRLGGAAMAIAGEQFDPARCRGRLEEIYGTFC